MSGQADEPTKKYTGQERDPNGRADYMLGRTYLYPFMRFATPDPARDGWSLYAYTGNNPVNYVDPDGTTCVTANGGKNTLCNPMDEMEISSESSNAQYIWAVIAETGGNTVTDMLGLNTIADAPHGTLDPTLSTGERGLSAAKGLGTIVADVAGGAIVGKVIKRLGGSLKGLKATGGAADDVIDTSREGAARITEGLSSLSSGRNPDVSVVGSAEELGNLYSQWSRGGTAIEGSIYPGQMVKLSDGTLVGMRSGSRSGGPTIDIKLPGEMRHKVHVQQ